MSSSPKHILFLVPYPVGQAPSQRFRFEQYFDLLKDNGFDFEVHSFFSARTWNILYTKGRVITKFIGIIGSILKRLLLLQRLGKFDFIFIHREVAPIGPPLIEWLIARVFRKKIIYDFDDAIWLPNTSTSNRLVSRLKWYGKVKQICRWSHRVSCGNKYLCDFASQFNNNVILNPTTVDTERYHNSFKDQYTERVVVGWTGSHSTIKYLNQIKPVIEKLEQDFNFQFMVISDVDPKLPLKSFKYIKWSKKSEIEDLLNFNIGVMPLTDDPWSRGKCGFKALQYLSLGIPTIASPVGVNQEIIVEGENGYLCLNNDCWETRLRELLIDQQKRTNLGENGRKKIIVDYSIAANSANFLSLFS